jgi:heat shock protein HtpX
LYAVPRPALWWSEFPEFNAFATGRDAEHAVVVMMRDTYQLLSPRELRAVLGHEFAHVKNADLRVTLFLDLLSLSVLRASRVLLVLQRELTVAALSALYEVLRGTLGLKQKQTIAMTDSRGELRVATTQHEYTTEGLVMTLTRAVLTAAGAVLLLPITVAAAFVYRVGWLVTRAVSRQRELLADATSVQLARDPGALADALERMSAEEWARRAEEAKPRQVIYRLGANCFTSQTTSWFLERFGASHPEDTDRIRRLRRLAAEMAPPAASAG